MIDERAREPKRRFIAQLPLESAEQNVLVDAHEVVAHIELQEPGRARSVRRHLAQESLQALHRGMHAFAPAAGIGVVDEHRLPDALQGLDQQVMHDPVPEIGGEDLAQLRSRGKKADRTAGTIRARHQRLIQIDQVAPLFGLKAQDVGCVALIAPAAAILPVEVFQ